MKRHMGNLKLPVETAVPIINLFISRYEFCTVLLAIKSNFCLMYTFRSKYHRINNALAEKRNRKDGSKSLLLLTDNNFRFSCPFLYGSIRPSSMKLPRNFVLESFHDYVGRRYTQKLARA